VNEEEKVNMEVHKILKEEKIKDDAKKNEPGIFRKYWYVIPVIFLVLLLVG
jgi:hypothetical protein